MDTIFFFKQKTAYEIGLGIPAERSSDLLCLVLLLAVLLLLLLVEPCLNCLEAVKKPPPVAFKVMCFLPITILEAYVVVGFNLPFKALIFLTLMRPALCLVLVLCLKLVNDF